MRCVFSRRMQVSPLSIVCSTFCAKIELWISLDDIILQLNKNATYGKAFKYFLVPFEKTVRIVFEFYGCLNIVKHFETLQKLCRKSKYVLSRIFGGNFEALILKKNIRLLLVTAYRIASLLDVLTFWNGRNLIEVVLKRSKLVFEKHIARNLV